MLLAMDPADDKTIKYLDRRAHALRSNQDLDHLRASVEQLPNLRRPGSESYILRAGPRDVTTNIHLEVNQNQPSNHDDDYERTNNTRRGPRSKLPSLLMILSIMPVLFYLSFTLVRSQKALEPQKYHVESSPPPSPFPYPSPSPPPVNDSNESTRIHIWQQGVRLGFSIDDKLGFVTFYIPGEMKLIIIEMEEILRNKDWQNNDRLNNVRMPSSHMS